MMVPACVLSIAYLAVTTELGSAFVQPSSSFLPSVRPTRAPDSQSVAVPVRRHGITMTVRKRHTAHVASRVCNHIAHAVSRMTSYCLPSIIWALSGMIDLQVWIRCMLTSSFPRTEPSYIAHQWFVVEHAAPPMVMSVTFTT